MSLPYWARRDLLLTGSSQFSEVARLGRTLRAWLQPNIVKGHVRDSLSDQAGCLHARAAGCGRGPLSGGIASSQVRSASASDGAVSIGSSDLSVVVPDRTQQFSAPPYPHQPPQDTLGRGPGEPGVALKCQGFSNGATGAINAEEAGQEPVDPAIDEQSVAEQLVAQARGNFDDPK